MANNFYRGIDVAFDRFEVQKEQGNVIICRNLMLDKIWLFEYAKDFNFKYVFSAGLC